MSAHSQQHPGLRGHSIGPAYPFTVVLLGPKGKRGYVLNAVTGETWPVESHAQADKRAGVLAESQRHAADMTVSEHKGRTAYDTGHP